MIFIMQHLEFEEIMQDLEMCDYFVCYLFSVKPFLMWAKYPNRDIFNKLFPDIYNYSYRPDGK